MLDIRMNNDEIDLREIEGTPMEIMTELVSLTGAIIKTTIKGYPDEEDQENFATFISTFYLEMLGQALAEINE